VLQQQQLPFWLLSKHTSFCSHRKLLFFFIYRIFYFTALKVVSLVSYRLHSNNVMAVTIWIDCVTATIAHNNKWFKQQKSFQIWIYIENFLRNLFFFQWCKIKLINIRELSDNLYRLFFLGQYEHNQLEMFGHLKMNGVLEYVVVVKILELVWKRK